MTLKIIVLKGVQTFKFVSQKDPLKRPLKKDLVNFFQAQKVATKPKDLEIDANILLYHLNKTL